MARTPPSETRNPAVVRAEHRKKLIRLARFLANRPSSVQEISQEFGLHKQVVRKYLADLERYKVKLLRTYRRRTGTGFPVVTIYEVLS